MTAIETRLRIRLWDKARKGPDPLDASATARQFPSLFQLAREAGFTTCYLDSQNVLHDHAVQDY
jgi:hypothetical protein